MKRILLLASAALVLSSSAYAGGYKQAGCGLGSMIIKDDGFAQVFAATTNGTSGSQTFGISSGTSNCEGSGGTATNDTEKNMYVSSNYDVLSQEMAQGSGEHLKALSSLMGCDQAHSGEFAQAMKSNYRSVAGSSPEQMLQQVKSKVSSDPQLKQACSI